MTKWTKGPWSLSEMWRPPVGNFDIDTDANGNIFYGYSITGRCEKGASILPTLAAVHNFPNNVEANAHLIASAPCLYQELAEMVELFHGYQGMELTRAKAALAKARGETS